MPKLHKSALLEVAPTCAYDVVADVCSYPEFVPGCDLVEVLESTATGLVARMSVSGKGVKETFITTNTNTPGVSVQMSLREGPFERLEGEWVVTALGEIGCRIDMHIDYEPKGVLVRLLRPLASHIANLMVDAFSARITERASDGAR